jgi:hypothetical protein
MSNVNDAQRVAVKVFAQPGREGADDLEPYIGVFQRWIQQDALEELMVDIADYRHVPNGPGVLLICHAAHYALDSSDGELGLQRSAKRGEPNGLHDKLQLALVRTLRAADKLQREQTLAPLRFNGGRLQLQLQDRLLAPNTPETLETLRPAFEQIVEQLYAGSAATVRRTSQDPRSAFAVTIESNAEDPPTIETLLARAEQLAAASPASA